MITDQKTQNRLHADTGTELFSIRQRKEAVTRMLDILKETPECLQVMNHIPAYAMDDDTSEWWKSEESENFMNSLLEVMESYTPGRIQVRTEIRHDRPLRLLGKQDRADNPLPSAFQSGKRI